MLTDPVALLLVAGGIYTILAMLGVTGLLSPAWDALKEIIRALWSLWLAPFNALYQRRDKATLEEIADREFRQRYPLGLVNSIDDPNIPIEDVISQIEMLEEGKAYRMPQVVSPDLPSLEDLMTKGLLDRGMLIPLIVRTDLNGAPIYDRRVPASMDKRHVFERGDE